MRFSITAKVLICNQNIVHQINNVSNIKPSMGKIIFFHIFGKTKKMVTVIKSLRILITHSKTQVLAGEHVMFIPWYSLGPPGPYVDISRS